MGFWSNYTLARTVVYFEKPSISMYTRICLSVCLSVAVKGRLLVGWLSFLEPAVWEEEDDAATSSQCNFLRCVWHLCYKQPVLSFPNSNNSFTVLSLQLRFICCFQNCEFWQEHIMFAILWERKLYYWKDYRLRLYPNLGYKIFLAKSAHIS